MQGGGQVTRHEGFVGEGRSQFQIQTDFLFEAVHWHTVDLAVTVHRCIDFAGVAKSHAHVSD